MVVPFRPQAPPGVVQARVDEVLPDYEAYLRNQGYGPSLFSNLTRTARHMVAWLTVTESDVAALDIRSVDGFLSHDCRCPPQCRCQMNDDTRWLAQRVLGYLIETGQAAVPPVIVTGGELVEAFLGTLAAQGYKESSIVRYRSSCRHLIVWLCRSDLALAEFDGGVLQKFLDHDCACAHPQFFGRPWQFAGGRTIEGRIVRFASFLVDQGVVAEWRDPVPARGRGAHVDAFLGWLREHRGVRESTVSSYDRYLRALLPLLGDSPETYDAASIRAVILDRSQFRSHGQLANESSALRSYLRFLAAQGLCRPGLAEMVPSIRRQPAAELPRYVEKADIEALIASCDTATPVGLRDRAVLLLLARLALRPGEVANLQLDDIDWEQALITVRGKPRRSGALPLPQDVGDALRDYILGGRPRLAGASVFQRAIAPHGGLSASAVSAIADRAKQRAGIDGDGLPAAYLFRHSRATHLLRDGSSLEAVGALLRHQLTKTTALYARVDIPMLRAVAQPWPEALR